MIEKIAKAVKSGNKKRGRNITIGAVVGFLLSCTAVMGADVIGEEIKNKNESGYDSINNKDISSSNSNGSATGVSVENSTIRDINNNGDISSSNSNGSATGVSVGNSTIRDINNNGDISSSNSVGSTTGVSVENSTIRDINNAGNIGANISAAGESHGIYIENSEFRDINNTGNIISAGLGNSGIYLRATHQRDINNTGSIMASGTPSYGIILSFFRSDNTVTINNDGVISAGLRGIQVESSSGDDISITVNNLGVISGKINTALFLSPDDGGTRRASNYGILATEGTAVMDNTSGKITENNYGLYIAGSTGIVTAGSGGSQTVKFGNSEREMTVKNAGITSGSGIGTATESIVLGSSNYDDYILNGKNNTLSVSGAGNEVNGSVINAYGTAVKFDDVAGGELTLSGTIVNGGIDGTNTISGSVNADTLTLQSGEITYTNSSTGTQNTIINREIDMGAGDDTLTVGNGTIMNGTIDGGSGNDSLNFKSAAARTSNNEEINIRHDILNFENMNINTNVTLFEKTVGSNGKLADLKVTGADSITIGADGVLSLRIDPTKTSGNKIIGHALYGNTGTITSDGGGKLLLALNGAGNDNVINFGTTTFDNSLVTGNEAVYQEDVTFDTTSLLHSVERITNNEIKITAKVNLPTRTPDDIAYEKLNKIYHSILSVNELGNFNIDDDEKLSMFLGYLNDIYAGNPYSYSSELSRKSMGMFRDIVTENIFRPEVNKWMIYGGLTHIDGGTKDTYYGKGYYTYDIGSSDIEADTKITGAYMLGEYGVSDTLTSGVIIGGNKLKSDLSNGSKVDGDALYMGAYAKKYVGNLKVTAGAGFQYGDYDADRLAINNAASSTGTPVMKYSDNYNDMTYDIYLNGRYSHNIGENLFLEPYGTLSYTYIKQDGADEGNKTLAIETDSKTFDYTTAKVGVDLKKVIPHEKGKSTVSAGVSYTRILDGADEEYITGRFKGGSDFDILVAHKNEDSIGLNAKYALELENGILFEVKGSYAVERDSHSGTGRNKTKGEWIVGVGLGYRF